MLQFLLRLSWKCGYLRALSLQGVCSSWKPVLSFFVHYASAIILDQIDVKTLVNTLGQTWKKKKRRSHQSSRHAFLSCSQVVLCCILLTISHWCKSVVQLAVINHYAWKMWFVRLKDTSQSPNEYLIRDDKQSHNKCETDYAETIVCSGNWTELVEHGRVQPCVSDFSIVLHHDRLRVPAEKQPLSPQQPG